MLIIRNCAHMQALSYGSPWVFMRTTGQEKRGRHIRWCSLQVAISCQGVQMWNPCAFLETLCLNKARASSCWEMGQETALHLGLWAKIHCFSERERSKNLFPCWWDGKFSCAQGPLPTQQKSAAFPLKSHHRYKLEFSSMGRRSKNTEKELPSKSRCTSLSKTDGRPGR